MEITTTTEKRIPAGRAAVTALAIIGFVALLIIGILLAIYTATNFPKLSLRSNGAAVTLSSLFHKKDDAKLEVVTATTTLPIEAPATTTVATSTATTTPDHTATPTGPAPLYGNSDLTVAITDMGYLSSGTDTNSFVSSSVVPAGYKGAVRFTIRNVGTNVTGSWKFTADAPTNPNFLFTSPYQQSLKPGDRIDYTLGFDHGTPGLRTVTVTVDQDNSVIESNESNNTDSRNIVIN